MENEKRRMWRNCICGTILIWAAMNLMSPLLCGAESDLASYYVPEDARGIVTIDMQRLSGSPFVKEFLTRFNNSDTGPSKALRKYGFGLGDSFDRGVVSVVSDPKSGEPVLIGVFDTKLSQADTKVIIEELSGESLSANDIAGKEVFPINKGKEAMTHLSENILLITKRQYIKSYLENLRKTVAGTPKLLEQKPALPRKDALIWGVFDFSDPAKSPVPAQMIPFTSNFAKAVVGLYPLEGKEEGLVLKAVLQCRNAEQPKALASLCEGFIKSSTKPAPLVGTMVTFNPVGNDLKVALTLSETMIERIKNDGRKQLDDQLALLKKRNAPMSIEELVPQHVPDEKNAAKDMKTILALMDENGDLKKLDGKWTDYGKDQSRIKPLVKKLIESGTADRLLDLVKKASAKQYLLYPRDWSAGMMMLLPELSKHRSLNRKLVAIAQYYASEGKRNEAYAILGQALKLNGLFRNEPIIISQLVWLACNGIVYKAIDNLVSQYGIGTETARMLMSKLADFKAQYPKSMASAFDAERIIVTAEAMDSTGKLKKEFSEYVKASLQIPFISSPQSWFLTGHECAFMIHGYSELLDSLDKPYQDKQTLAQLKRLEEDVKSSKILVLSRMLFPAMFKIREKVAMAEACADAEILTLALQVYKNEHKTFPNSLDQLSPKILHNVPVNALTGKPFVYSRNGNEYVLKKPK